MSRLECGEDEKNPIYIQILGDRGFVWNPDDVFQLRRKHRIVGSLVGNNPRQSREKPCLPLVLNPQEMQIIQEKGAGQLVEIPSLRLPPDSATVSRTQQYREQSYQEQVGILREERKKEIIGMADRIVAGKWKKLMQVHNSQKKARQRCLDQQAISQEEDDESREHPMPDIDREAVINEEIAKIQPIHRKLQILQIFTSHPWLSEDAYLPASWCYPRDRLNQCRLTAFRDLWEHGYYLSEGSKFGADFLVYEGDPIRFHAKYILVCLESLDASFPCHRPQDLVARSRLANSVTKILLLAWLDSPTGQLKYKSLVRAEDTERPLQEIPVAPQ